MHQCIQHGNGITLSEIDDILAHFHAELKKEIAQVSKHQAQKRKRWKTKSGILQVKAEDPNVDMSDI